MVAPMYTNMEKRTTMSFTAPRQDPYTLLNESRRMAPVVEAAVMPIACYRHGVVEPPPGPLAIALRHHLRAAWKCFRALIVSRLV